MPLVNDGQLARFVLVWLGERAVVSFTELVIPDCGRNSACIGRGSLDVVLLLLAAVVNVPLVDDALPLRQLVEEFLGMAGSTDRLDVLQSGGRVH